MKSLILLLALSGCATFPEGVEMSDADKASCAAQMNCTVWTVDELKGILRRAFEAGYQQGKRSI